MFSLHKLKVMDDEAAKEQSRELRILKYNCYKHLGDMFHLDGDSNKAFDYIFKARDLDDKDVFEMHKWGQIALQQKQLLVAHDFFVKVISSQIFYTNNIPIFSSISVYYYLFDYDLKGNQTKSQTLAINAGYFGCIVRGRKLFRSLWMGITYFSQLCRRSNCCRCDSGYTR